MQGVAYVYLVHRQITGSVLRCTDLIGKIGKGTGKRIDAYRTPYGSDNLIIDTWNCETEQAALTLEGAILDILEMRGWLRYHAPKNNRKGKRAEVISFPFKGNDQSSLITEYKENMRWIYTLISHHHKLSIDNKCMSQWVDTLQLVRQLKDKISNNTVSLSDRKDMKLIFLLDVKLVDRDGTTTIIFTKEKEGCIIL